MKSLFEELSSLCKGRVLKDEPMSRHTTFRIGGPADVMFIPLDVKDLEKGAELIRKSGSAWAVIGKGSNLLVSDRGIRGVVTVIAGNMNNVEIKGTSVIAGAGIIMNDLIKLCCENGLAGLEGLAGIPSALGGALSMNMSSKDASISDHIAGVSVMDCAGNLKKTAKKDCGFAYRSSGLVGDKEMIVAAEFLLSEGRSEELLKKREAVLKQKASSQPLNLPSAGCIFKNTASAPAGKLIEDAGLKGARQGGAAVSTVHANYIVNEGGAKASDVMGLIERIRSSVKDKYGISLELEIKTLGF